MGWTGDGLDVGIWGELYSNWGRIAAKRLMYFRSKTRLIPCVEFFKIDAKTGARSVVRSSHWTKHLNDPTAKDLEWWSHKIPLPSQPLPADTRTWQPFLVLNTQRCYIAVGDVIPSDKPKQCTEICLQGESGELVGAVRLNEMSFDHLKREKLELVVLSKAITTDSRTTVVPEFRIIHAHCQKQCVFEAECQAEKRFVPYEYYNVMWIGWNGSVAHRKAIGRVLASYWDAMSPKEVETTLG